MSQFLFDKATMALKAGRYEEATSAYEQALEKEYSIDGWCGLGLCKLFQLSNGVIIDEVTFCFSKAAELDESKKKEIDLRLIAYSQLVMEQLAGYAIESIKQLKSAKEAAQSAAFWGALAGTLSATSKSGTFKTITGLTSGISAGVSVGKFAEMKSAKESTLFALNIIRAVTNSISSFIGKNIESDEAKLFLESMRELKNNIQSELDPDFDPRVSNALLDAKLSKEGKELLLNFAKSNGINIVQAPEVIKSANSVTGIFPMDSKDEIEEMTKRESFMFGTNEGFLFANEITLYLGRTLTTKKHFFSCTYKDLLTLEYKPAGGLFSLGEIKINGKTWNKGNTLTGIKKEHLDFWESLKELIKNNSEHF